MEHQYKMELCTVLFCFIISSKSLAHTLIIYKIVHIANRIRYDGGMYEYYFLWMEILSVTLLKTQKPTI